MVVAGTAAAGMEAVAIGTVVAGMVAVAIGTAAAAAGTAAEDITTNADRALHRRMTGDK